jgi:hypothetical protein
MRCLCIYVQELNWNLRHMILGSYIQILAYQVTSYHAQDYGKSRVMIVTREL